MSLSVRSLIFGIAVAATLLLPWPGVQGQQRRQDAALAPVAALGTISEIEKRIILTRLQAALSKHYVLVTQDEYAKAEQRAFQDLDAANCTEEMCIRKIQELLQVERLFVLQLIRDRDFAQLGLTLVRRNEKMVAEDSCEGCTTGQLHARVDALVAQIAAIDSGGPGAAVAQAPQPIPPPPPPRPVASVASVAPTPSLRPAPSVPIATAPPAPTEAPEAQPARTQGEVWREPTTGMEFVAVRGGVFGMGCGIWAGWCFDNEKPAHTVRINPFWMGRTEVTVGQFTAFVNATGYRTEAERGDGCTVWQVGSAGATSVVAAEANYRSPGYKLTDSHPVTCVSWNDVRAYTEWLSQKGAPKFRLPTEAEWEFACRVAGRQVTYGTYGTGNPNGNLRGSLSRYDTFEGPVPVHSYRENALGLFDMSGNVGEWVQDAFAPYQADAGGAADNPVVSAGDKRIRRGGSWFYEARVQRCGNRAGWTPSARTDDLGFRLVVK